MTVIIENDKEWNDDTNPKSDISRVCQHNIGS